MKLSSKLKNKLKKYKFIRDIYRKKVASSYFKSKTKQIKKWLKNSNEITNFTYDLTEQNISYLALTISSIKNIPYKTILDYINEAHSDTELKELIKGKIENSIYQDIADQTVYFGRRLGWYALARALKPKIVVETGIDKGHGAVLLCSALLRNKSEGYDGHYYGTDIRPSAGLLLCGK